MATPHIHTAIAQTKAGMGEINSLRGYHLYSKKILAQITPSTEQFEPRF